LELAIVVFPDDPELNDTLRNRDNLQSSSIFWMLLEKSALLEGGSEL
jgi:hypothetical protein